MALTAMHNLLFTLKNKLENVKHSCFKKTAYVMNNKFLCTDFCLLECDVSEGEVVPVSIYKAS